MKIEFWLVEKDGEGLDTERELHSLKANCVPVVGDGFSFYDYSKGKYDRVRGKVISVDWIVNKMSEPLSNDPDADEYCAQVRVSK